jgi:hypothetical protein
MNESFWNGFEKQALSSDLARRAAAQRAEAAAAAKKKNDAVLGTLSGMGDDMAIRNLLRKIG